MDSEKQEDKDWWWLDDLRCLIVNIVVPFGLVLIGLFGWGVDEDAQRSARDAGLFGMGIGIRNNGNKDTKTK